jgi:hypothetical protein
VSEWINAKFRKPFTPENLKQSEELGHQFYYSKPVLCVVKSGLGGSYMRVGKYCGYDRKWTEFERGEYRGTSHVTHWMPLPEFPE